MKTRNDEIRQKLIATLYHQVVLKKIKLKNVASCLYQKGALDGYFLEQLGYDLAIPCLSSASSYVDEAFPI